MEQGAFDVHSQRTIDKRLRNHAEHAVLHNAGVIHQHIQPFELLEYFRVTGFHRHRFGGIRTEPDCGSGKTGAKLGYSLIEQLLIGPAVEDDHRAMLGEQPRRGPTDSSRGAGDEGDLSVEHPCFARCIFLR